MDPHFHLSRPIRFGDFQLDPTAGELRKDDLHIRLGERALRLLLALTEHPGRVVTREELRRSVWPEGTYLDFEDGLNHAVKKLREVLEDSAEHPRFIETLPRHGYRFIAPVEIIEQESPPGSEVGTSLLNAPGSKSTGRRKGKALAYAAFGLLAVILMALWFLRTRETRDRLLDWIAPPPHIQSLAVLPLANLSDDPKQEFFADAMTEELITDLGQAKNLRVISRTSVMRYKRTKEPIQEIGKELKVDEIVEGGVLRSNGRVRITAQLIDARTDRHLWAKRYESDLQDTIVLQHQVAHDISQAVRAKLTPR